MGCPYEACGLSIYISKTGYPDWVAREKINADIAVRERE